jgi:hypothetical protein
MTTLDPSLPVRLFGLRRDKHGLLPEALFPLTIRTLESNETVATRTRTALSDTTIMLFLDMQR